MFKSGLGGKLTLKLDDAELGVLSQLFEQMAELLEHPESEAGTDPLAKMLNLRPMVFQTGCFPPNASNSPHFAWQAPQFVAKNLLPN